MFGMVCDCQNVNLTLRVVLLHFQQIFIHAASTTFSNGINWDFVKVIRLLKYI